MRVGRTVHGADMSQLLAASTTQQLEWIAKQIESKDADDPRHHHMLMSLAESVKTARDHNLNCEVPRHIRPERHPENVIIGRVLVGGILPDHEAKHFIIGESYTVRFGNDPPRTGLRCTVNEPVVEGYSRVQLEP